MNRFFHWITLALGLAIVSPAIAQTTNVTGQLTDVQGTVWANAAVSYRLANPVGAPPVYTATGAPVPVSGSTTANSAGSFTLPVPSVNAISPAGVAWAIQICPIATGGCTTITPVAATGTTFSLAPQLAANPLPAPVVNALLPNAIAYNVGELQPGTVGYGSRYFDSTLNLTRAYTASGWVGTGGIAGGAPNSLAAFNASGSTVQSAAGITINANGGFNGAGYSEFAQTATLLPSIDPAHSQFGLNSNCGNSADRTGTNDSGCAIQAALTYAAAHATSGTGAITVKLAAGTYNIGTNYTGYTPILQMAQGETLICESPSACVINDLAPHAAALRLSANNGGCASNTLASCRELVSGIRFQGIGHLGNQTGIEIQNIQNVVFFDNIVSNFGAIGMNFTGSAERDVTMVTELNNDNIAVNMDGDTNEDYFYRVNVDGPGQDSGSYCYDRRNCTNGVANSGTPLPNYTAAVHLDGVNIHWIDSSIKSLAFRAGVKITNGEAITAEGNYTEGYVPGYINPDYQLIGATEIGQLTANITASATTIPVNDAIYQPLYYSDPGTISLLGIHSYVNTFQIYPIDYVSGDTTDVSASYGGSGTTIYKGTVETLTINAFAADGNGYVIARGNSGNGYNWKSGAFILQPAHGFYGTPGLYHNHLGAMNPSTNSANVCSDTVPISNWYSANLGGSPYTGCAAIFVGPMPDGLDVPYPSNTVYGTQSASVLEVGNTDYFAVNGEQVGEGWNKIADDGSVTIYDQNNNQQIAALAGNYITNAGTDAYDRVSFTQWATNVWAEGTVINAETRTVLSPHGNFVEQDYTNNGVWYNSGGPTAYCMADFMPATASFGYYACAYQGYWAIGQNGNNYFAVSSSSATSVVPINGTTATFSGLGTFAGLVNTAAPPVGDNSTKVPTTAWVTGAINAVTTYFGSAPGCTTGASTYNTCTTTVNWNVTMPSVPSVVVCTGSGASDPRAQLLGQSNPTTTGTTVTTVTEGSVAVSYGSIECIAHP